MKSKTDISRNSQSTSQAGDKKTYVKPVLTLYGDARDLTLAISPGILESGREATHRR